MSELIDRQAAIDVLCDACGNCACPKGKIPRCSYYEKMQAIPTASPWHRVEEELPDDEVPVLAMLHNTYGRNVVLKLCHIGHHKRTTEEYGWQEYEGETEYDEENDCFWIPEGWWESNYHEDNLNWQIGETDGTITHWMPLPEPPKEDA